MPPAQRCDALYGDWLLQLDSPAGPAQLQVRSFLIGQGALAANYLAELAQNADDACDGTADAEVRLIVAGDWLLVANIGRKVTPGNLLGLCRFFVHRDGKIRELDAATIGRFGIGFKSCVRSARAELGREGRIRVPAADFKGQRPDLVAQSRAPAPGDPATRASGRGDRRGLAETR